MAKNVYLDLDKFREPLLKYTRKAFQMLPRLEKPYILDIGCGTGVPTIELAKLSDGKVIGIDIDQAHLDVLNLKIESEGLSYRVKSRKISMLNMDFVEESFDIIWAEGVFSVLEFEEAIKEWRKFLKPNGFLVAHDASRDITSRVKKIPNYGYKLINHFELPKDAWWVDFYSPIENQMDTLLKKYEGDAKALNELKRYKSDIGECKKNPEVFGSIIYIIQKYKIVQEN